MYQIFEIIGIVQDCIEEVLKILIYFANFSKGSSKRDFFAIGIHFSLPKDIKKLQAKKKIFIGDDCLYRVDHLYMDRLCLLK